MPHLVCRSCGRRIYTVSSLESLSGDELRCARCGSALNAERRENQRRRQDDSHPPAESAANVRDAASAAART